MTLPHPSPTPAAWPRLPLLPALAPSSPHPCSPFPAPQAGDHHYLGVCLDPGEVGGRGAPSMAPTPALLPPVGGADAGGSL